MPSNTTHLLPYPLPTEPVKDGANNIKALAESVDAKVLNGRIDWGPVGAPDTHLYRSAPGILKTDGDFEAGSAIFANKGLAWQTTLGGGGSGQATVYFGSALDAALYRPASDQLRTDNTFVHGKDVWIGYLDSTKRLYFGSAGDTYLERSAAQALRTNAFFQIVPVGPAANQAAFVVQFNGMAGARYIECGAPDSGGPGFRMLRIAN